MKLVDDCIYEVYGKVSSPVPLSLLLFVQCVECVTVCCVACSN